MAVCVRLATPHMAATQVACVRFAGSFLILVLATRARQLRPAKGNAGRLILRGLLGGSAITCYYIGIGRAGAALATLLHSTYPVFTALFAVLLLGEPFTRRLGGALALNLVGTAVVLGSPRDLGTQVGSGTLVALLGGVLAGGALATASDLRRSESACPGHDLVHRGGRAADRAVVRRRGARVVVDPGARARRRRRDLGVGAVAAAPRSRLRLRHHLFEDWARRSTRRGYSPFAPTSHLPGASTSTPPFRHEKANQGDHL
jgi:uncharacterized membrane protein